MGAVWLWRQRLRRRWWSVLVGIALFLAIPFGVSALSRGITPPADGTPLGLWLTWQLALFLAATGPLVLASALIRGDAEPRRSQLVVVAWRGRCDTCHRRRPLCLAAHRRMARLVPAALGAGAAGREPAALHGTGGREFRFRGREPVVRAHLAGRAERPDAAGTARGVPARQRARSRWPGRCSSSSATPSTRPHLRSLRPSSMCCGARRCWRSRATRRGSRSGRRVLVGAPNWRSTRSRSGVRHSTRC